MAGFEGFEGGFAKALEQMIRDSGGRIWIVSGYRSVEEQQSLWDNAVAKYGSEDAARQWVAPPGRSNHNHGVAADLGFSDGGLEWAHANAARYGLNFPMEWEDWHIEPTGVRDGSYTAQAHAHDEEEVSGVAHPSPYTDPPTGFVSAQDPSRNFDLGQQLQRLNAMLLAPPEQPAEPARTRPEMYL